MTFQDIFMSSFLENVTSVSPLDMVLALGLVVAFRFQPRGCTRRKKDNKQSQVPAGRH